MSIDVSQIEVKLSLAQLRQLESDKQDAEHKVIALQQQLATAQLADPSGVVTTLRAALEAARQIVAFAVANCPPESVRGWPIQALRDLAEAYLRVPGISTDNEQQALDWKIFASEAAAVETQRRLQAVATAVSPKSEPASETES